NPNVFLSLRSRRHRVRGFGALYSLRRDFERPGQHKRNWQTDDDQQNDQSNGPVRNVEDRKNLRDSLRKRPTGDDVSDRDLVNVAPLQLGEEVVDLHFGFSSQSFWKRGSLRSGSHTGSTRSEALDRA